MNRRHIPIDALRSEAEDWSDFLRKLSARAEEVGILVLHAGIVGSNTHRPPGRHEVAGLAVADPVEDVSFKESVSLLNLSPSSFMRYLVRQSDALHS